MTKSTFRVTDKAGDWVAGRPVPADRKLLLSEDEAAHDLRLGTIVRVGSSVPKEQGKQPAPPAAADSVQKAKK